MSATLTEKILAYNKFAKTHDHAMQLSKERSGRVWLSSLVHRLTGVTGWNLELSQPVDGDLDEKELPNYFHAHLHSGDPMQFFPHVKYIFLLRDPRDAYCSQVDVNILQGGSISIWENFHRTETWCMEWKRYFKQLPYQDTLLVQYEMLCLNTHATLRKVCDHIGHEVISNIPEVVVASDRYYSKIRSAPEVSSGKERYKEHCLKWKRHPLFTERHNDIILELLGDTMVHYGYFKDGHARNF